jgi:aspartate-semialdehyde dehydrogenase
MAGDGYRVGVLGATGLVGTTILDLLAARGFPAAEVIPFASQRSAGKSIQWGEGELEVRPLSDETIQGLDLALSSSGGSVSAEWTPKLVEAGAVVVDNTSYWRMHEGVPLVVSEVNPEALDGHKGIVANPNCTTMEMVVALAPIHRAAGLERVILSSYQSVSGTGRRAIEELRTQTADVLAGREAKAEVYPHQIAFNALPQVDVFLDNGYTREEWKLVTESRKILHLPDLRISSTAVRIPVFVAHSEAVHVETVDPITPERARTLFAAVPGVVVQDDPSTSTYPLATEAAGTDEVYVGRVRQDPSIDGGRGLAFWVVSDNLRKGAATNAVEIAEILVDRGWVSAAATRDAAGSPA